MPSNSSATPLPILPNELENIALSFSGGGFRAAGFSIGCFSYLDDIKFGEKKLSELVRFISSASGGSFANMAIVYAQRKSLGYKQAYKIIFEALDGAAILLRVHEILTDNKIWENERPSKTRNFINAFAIAYDELLFKDELFGMMWQNNNAHNNIEICVNSTDFNHGEQFRFQYEDTQNYKAVFGNKYLTIKKPIKEHLETIKQLKLGDILAASSCFPGGFEPILYPDDFAWKNDTKKMALSVEQLSAALESDDKFIKTATEEANSKETKRVFGFMDGGIVDNQGISAFNLAEERLQNLQEKQQKELLEKEKKELLAKSNLSEEEKTKIETKYEQKKDLAEGNGYGYDLYAICDVSSNYTNEYHYPTENKSNYLLSLSIFTYFVLFILLTVLGLSGIIGGYFPLAGGILAGAFGFPVFIGLLLFLCITFKKIFSNTVNTVTNHSFRKIFGNHIRYFLNLPLSKAINLIAARATSLAQLGMTIFLKKVRQDAYDEHFDSDESLSKLALHFERALDAGIINNLDKAALTKYLQLRQKRGYNTINPTIYLFSKKYEKMFISLLIAQASFSENDAIFETLKPTPRMVEMANIGTEMETTLWFDETHVAQNMRAILIATGQFTICHNLVLFSLRFANNSNEWEAFKATVMDHWLQFKKNPYWLYNRIGNEMITDNTPLKGFLEMCA